ncbi:hypothetical protein ACHAWF_002335 [Thalassiosira exigua]
MASAGNRGGNDDNDKSTRGQMRWKLARSARMARCALRAATSAKLAASALALVFAAFLVGDDERQSDLLKLGAGYLFVARPLLSCVEVASRPAKDVGVTTRVVVLSFLASVVCTQLPKWLRTLAGCSAVYVFGLASRGMATPQSRPAKKRAPMENATTMAGDGGSNPLQRMWYRLGIRERALIGTISVVTSLLTENFIIWVVSATYQPGIDGKYEPLQDNGRIVMEALVTRIFHVDQARMAKRPLQNLRNLLNVQWALVAGLAASFVCLDLRLGGGGQRANHFLGLALHALATIASARLIRTISFVLTVLPSQVRNCYVHRFPPPPEEWGAWIMVGFLPQSRGGCNDLILSGHATITSTFACACTSAAADASFSTAVWTLVALDYAIETYQGLHYSVDMWLGCIVTCLLWQLTKPLEIGNEAEQAEIQAGQKATMEEPPPLNATIAAMYALPAAVVFVVLVAVPEAYVNYFIVGYAAWAGAIYARRGVTHFSQHLLMCLLCNALGAYL